MKKLLLIVLVSMFTSPIFAQEKDYWTNQQLIEYGSVPNLPQQVQQQGFTYSEERLAQMRNPVLIRQVTRETPRNEIIYLSRLDEESRLKMNSVSHIYVRGFLSPRYETGIILTGRGGQYSGPVLSRPYLQRSLMPDNIVDILKNHPTDWVEEILKVQPSVYITFILPDTNGNLARKHYYVVK